MSEKKYTRREFKAYNEAATRVVLADDDQIPSHCVFHAGGREWYSLTASVGYVNEIAPGISVAAGMVNDPINPLPSNAITAVPVEEVWFAAADTEAES